MAGALMHSLDELSMKWGGRLARHAAKRRSGLEDSRGPLLDGKTLVD
jgi:hypothetical protein